MARRKKATDFVPSPWTQPGAKDYNTNKFRFEVPISRPKKDIVFSPWIKPGKKDSVRFEIKVGLSIYGPKCEECGGRENLFGRNVNKNGRFHHAQICCKKCLEEIK